MNHPQDQPLAQCNKKHHQYNHGPTVKIDPTQYIYHKKAPPIEAFIATIHWDDWLSTLEQAATCNNWSEQEKLAGHLHGKAQKEWNLKTESFKVCISAGVKILRARVDFGSRAIAAQDFRYPSQLTVQSVADFVCGHKQMTEEIKNTLLYGQLNEALKYSLIKAPAVSGAPEFQQLCLAACNEERLQSKMMK